MRILVYLKYMFPQTVTCWRFSYANAIEVGSKGVRPGFDPEPLPGQ